MKKNSMTDMRRGELESLGQLLFLGSPKLEQTFFDFKDAKEILTLLFEDAIAHATESKDLKIDL